MMKISGGDENIFGAMNILFWGFITNTVSINCATIHQEINKVYYSSVTVFFSKSFHMESKTGITNLCLLTSLKKSFTVAQIKNDCTSKTRTESFTNFYHSTF